MKKCPNCTQDVAQQNPGCLLHDLVQVARERGELDESRLQAVHAGYNVDWLWDKLGPIVDDIEDMANEEEDAA